MFKLRHAEDGLGDLYDQFSKLRDITTILNMGSDPQLALVNLRLKFTAQLDQKKNEIYTHLVKRRDQIEDIIKKSAIDESDAKELRAKLFPSAIAGKYYPELTAPKDK
jgi:hypothetical protein